MKLFYSEHNLAGTVGLLVQNKDGSLAMYDWKRSGKSVSKGAKGWECGLGPLSKLPDNHYYRYAMQMNLYREILERYYVYSDAAMYIVRLHPDAK